MYLKKDLAKDVYLIKQIQWKSTDKDNMEFEAYATCFQKDAINRLVGFANSLLV